VAEEKPKAEAKAKAKAKGKAKNAPIAICRYRDSEAWLEEGRRRAGVVPDWQLLLQVPDPLAVFDNNGNILPDNRATAVAFAPNWQGLPPLQGDYDDSDEPPPLLESSPGEDYLQDRELSSDEELSQLVAGTPTGWFNMELFRSIRQTSTAQSSTEASTQAVRTATDTDQPFMSDASAAYVRSFADEVQNEDDIMLATRIISESNSHRTARRTNPQAPENQGLLGRLMRVLHWSRTTPVATNRDVLGCYYREFGGTDAETGIVHKPRIVYRFSGNADEDYDGDAEAESDCASSAYSDDTEGASSVSSFEYSDKQCELPPSTAALPAPRKKASAMPATPGVRYWLADTGCPVIRHGRSSDLAGIRS
jgi:hypothetical protein